MKTIVLFASLAFLICSQAFASDVPANDRAAIEKFLSLLKNADKAAVAKMIRYPLRRSAPLDAIQSEKNFVDHYNEFFDAANISKAISAEKDVWANWQGSSLGDGLIWFSDGKIIAINMSTPLALKVHAAAVSSDSAKLHPDAKRYDKILFECQSKKHHIRIQERDGNVIYYSWKANQPLTEKPEMELKGTGSPDGSGGNMSYKFANGNYTYEVQETQLCGEDCHSHLIVSQKSKVIADEVCNALAN